MRWRAFDTGPFTVEAGGADELLRRGKLHKAVPEMAGVARRAGDISFLMGTPETTADIAGLGRAVSIESVCGPRAGEDVLAFTSDIDLAAGDVIGGH